ncbi:HIT family protein [Mycobacteroides abscessus]|uniref:HIT family protein n=1 Tax=Mycobacteroides abscessus TaxID=36809 RepID=UPI0005EA2BBF|nr:HIT family protein [Mycobacteroides abscessus]AMU53797.1 HIT family hydrolase [Mycobacteroides abscessus]MBE5435452.1 hypothetical protein [Mycobacteroides abscessus]MBN7446490.1 HIT family protein [Mycobacteroides abscessus subsp. abscessus]MBN7449583.1 HIT family protein [Mycobacteroides abscessus subsp. abscessus]MDM1896462.1 HIT family protein [Mycobacteroides abscessus]
MSDPSALEVPEKPRCAFCEYLSGQRVFTIVARTEDIAVLVTREQRGLPHLLVVPIAHRETILNLTDTELASLAIGVQSAAQAIDTAYERPGIAIWQNNGIPAHQTIPHVHFHVAGTLPEGGTDWGRVQEAPLEDTEAIARIIAPHLHLR